jgi:TonB-dependent SusC/RagA subfamily outer membrane receptor
MLKRTIARRRLLPLLALLCAGPAAAQSTTAAVRGQVTDSAAQRPLAGAEVYVVTSGASGITRVVRTNAAGQYSVAGLPAGQAMVRVRLVGFAPRGQGVTLRDGETAVADFALGERLTQLNEVVVTGTGGAVERRAVGNVIETIKAEDVLAVAPARSVEQLIGARTPGLIVLPATGQVGTGAQLKVRGTSSLSLSNDPIIYIDGVRMDANTSRGQAQRGGAGASRLNDVNPEDIESIEVLKGPAASTLYGTEASNGVIQIITKRGRSGQTNFNFTTRQGTNWLANPEGRAGILWGKTAAGEIINFNLYQHELEAGNGPVFHNGRNSGYNLSLNGGTDLARYYMSGSYDDDVGVVNYNWDKKFNGRANIDVGIGSKVRLNGSLGYIRDRIRFMQPSIEADPFSNLVWGTPLTANGIKRGFGFTPPEEWSTIESHADNDRTTISLTATYEPKDWWSNRLVTGLDVNSENNWLLFPRQPVPSTDPLGSQALGSKDIQRASRNFLTLDYSSSLKYGWSEALRFTTSVGLQHYRSELSQVTTRASVFPAGPLTTISAGTSTSGLEAYEANATVGMFVQQQLAWNNRVFLTAALRGDDNSAFGKSFSAAYYPKVSGSWVVSEEPWFRLPGVTDLRLRGALGVAGTQPGTFDAAQLYAASVGAADQPGLIPNQLGNPALKPERSREIEVGFETTLLKGRADVSYTHYSRKISDEIVNAPIPPSAGYPGFQTLNIGQVSGWGDELAVNARLIDGPRFAWEMGTQLSNNQNRIDDMGGTTFLTVGGGGQAQNRVGFGIADFFLYKYRSAVLDANGNIVSMMCDGGTGPSGLEMGGPDVPCAQAPRVYWGHSQPTWQVGLNTTVTLFRNLRLYGRVDGNGGHLQSNTEIRALHNQGSTEAVIRRNDPQLQVYRAIEADAVGTYEAGFLRLRELSATYSLPTSLASRMRASAATISAAGRNLSMLWTAAQGWNTSRDGEIYVPVANQHVWDPEIRANGPLSNGFQTILPPTASFTLTLRLNF